MTTIEPRSLLEGKIRNIHPNEEIESIFRQYKKLVQESSSKKELTDFDFFFAGYVLSNPTVRQQFKKSKRKGNIQEY